jgi:hypothetical protein
VKKGRCECATLDSRAGRSESEYLIVTGTGRNAQFSGLGLRPRAVDTQPLTPRPSPEAVRVVSTVMWTAGKGAVSLEK